MMTNAQAALQAAASMYSTGASAQEEIATDSLLMDAANFKAWLDEQDKADRHRKPPKMTRESASEHYGTPPAPPRDRYTPSGRDTSRDPF